MFTVIVDLFDALNHFKTTCPWTGTVSIWLTNHSHLRGAKHFSILGRFSNILRQVSESVIKLSRQVNRFSSKKTQLLSRSLLKTIWPRFAIQRHKKHKGTKTHSIIFPKSTVVVTHNRVTGLLAAKWLSKTKKCSNQFSTSRYVPLKQQRKVLSKFIKTRISSLIQAILPLSIEAAPI